MVFNGGQSESFQPTDNIGSTFSMREGTNGPSENPLHVAFLDATRPPQRLSDNLVLAQAAPTTLEAYTTLPPAPNADRFANIFSDDYRDTRNNDLAGMIAYLDLNITQATDKLLPTGLAEGRLNTMIEEAKRAYDQNKGMMEGYRLLFLRDHRDRLLGLGGGRFAERSGGLQDETRRLADEMIRQRR